ncbi:uncharacterized protein LOC134435534 [Engraulis encrasicolus]|uniref:uncharacterized protein LOC134435534 n=1 Tax=Engraulis encrasicolus TaxID=184585 RepID=UPI002FD53687
MSGREKDGERDQIGNLVPPDVVEVLALDRHGGKGKRRKKRGGSLRRAFSWLRRGKRAKSAYASRHGNDLLSPETPVPLPQPNPKAASHEDNAAVLVPHLFQDNVFAEGGSRHKYVEDLHSEALQGLKLKQLEENKMDTDYADTQSVISGVTSQNEGGSCSERRKSIGSESTATDTMSTVSTQSTISSRSTRSALSRQGSTFTPLNLGKKERPKGRRRHRRTTVMGIPRHVQKELGLDRALWTAYQRSQEPVPTEDFTDMPGITVTATPAPDGPVPSTARPQQQKASGQPPQRPKDDLALIQSALPPQSSSTQRPMSLAVPWATTANAAAGGEGGGGGGGGSLQPPSSPVMYISPQGMYLSKLIPNAVLPPSVDVVEINRNRSRNSVRTVSKCSLASASPAPSRTSSRASSKRHYPRPSESSSSAWSRSDSSETLVSDSSTISSSSTARAPSSGRDSVVEARPAKAPGGDARPNGQVKTMMMMTTTTADGDQSIGQFTRSLSVMKRTKKPPPPSRSYSLHKDKMKRRSRDLAEAKIDFSGVTPKSGKERVHGESPGYSADESAVEESFSSGAPSPPSAQHQASRGGGNSVPSQPLNLLALEKGLKRNLSPSSGYSSHNGTPHLKELHLHSAGAADQKQVKSELMGLSPNNTKPAILALKALFEIPKHPKITAPPPPPPEAWAHNQRTFVLLCGPGPANIKFATPPSPKQSPQPAPQVKGEIPSAEVPSALSGDNWQHAATEQASSSVSKTPIPAQPNNPSLMQELLKAQQSHDKRDHCQAADVPAGPPLSPPLPPPPPDMLLDPALDEADLPPPPPLFSPTSPKATPYQAMPLGIPPPPLQPPPPPPQHAPPPPPVAVPPPPPVTVPPPPPVTVPPPPPVTVPPPPPPSAEVPAPVAVPPPKEDAPHVPQPPPAPDIPKPPPLPADFKTQPPPVAFKSLRKVPPPQKKEPPKPIDDSPVVTPSILQKVRLRSIKNPQPKPEPSATEVTVAEPTEQKPTAASHMAPPKPIRRSLLLAEPPPDVAAVIAEEAKSSPSDAPQQASEAEAAVKNSPSDITVVKSQSEQPAVTPQLDSTDTDSKSEVADSKPQPEPQSEVAESKPPPEPTASVSNLEPSKLESQPEAVIPDTKTDQSNTESEQPSSALDSQAPVKSEPEATVSKPEPEQVAPKPEQVSAPEISEPEQTKEPSHPEPPTVDSLSSTDQKLQPNSVEVVTEEVAPNIKAPECKSDAEVPIAKTSEKPQCDTSVTTEQVAPSSKVTTEQVAPSSKPQEVEAECKSDAEGSAATTEQTRPETEPLISKPEPEQISESPPLEPSLPPAASDTVTSTPDQESNLPVNQAKNQTDVSKSDTEPPVSTDPPELNATETKADIPSLPSESEPVSTVSKSEPESVVSQVLPTTKTESNPEPALSGSTSESVSKPKPETKSESVSEATASPPKTTTPAPTASITSASSTVASKPTITVSAPLASSTTSNTQTNKPASPTSLTAKSPPVSAASPSMRLQEAIRQRAAARSATDGPAKRLSLHSPPASVTSGALKSPTSTASFIFSKSNKKVVSETSTVPQVQPAAKKTPPAQTEPAAAAPSQPKPGDGLKNSKVPPPVASKPRPKMQSQKNGLHNPSTEESIAAEVQTAGQSAPSEDTRNTA